MAYPVSVKKNDYINNPKRSDIYTPKPLAKWLADLVSPYLKSGIVFDPACGDGRLLEPFNEHIGLTPIGIDKNVDTIHEYKNHVLFKIGAKDFLTDDIPNLKNLTVSLVICNPPFNYDKGGTGRKLLPELFLRAIEQKIGTVPVILFTPMGFVLNQRKNSTRWKWLRDECSLKITGRIALPIDIFPHTQFHQEILLFNLPEIEAHYWLPEKVIKECES